MDWTKIKLPKVDSRIQAGLLPKLEHWKLVVLAKVLGRSLSSLSRDALVLGLKTILSDFEERLQSEATSHEVTPEALFCFLMQKENCLDENAIARLRTEKNQEPPEFEILRRLASGEAVTTSDLVFASSEIGIPVETLKKLLPGDPQCCQEQSL